jgi:predicted O-methyltransferase YrrM
MQISPHQGQQIGLLARAIGARRAVEVGTFTGYSALCIAEALPPDGKLWCCDVSETWTKVARRAWKEAGIESRIELTIGPALGTLDWLLAQGLTGQLDLAFIDANKDDYDAYYERCLKLVRRGGLILIDNVLWRGWVANLAHVDADTMAIRALNAKLKSDERVDLVLFAVGDGMTCALKR